MVYEIVREREWYGFNVLNFHGQVVDYDFYFKDGEEARFVVETLYPGIKELGC